MPITRWNQPATANTQVTGIQSDTSVAVLSDGGYVVVWADLSTADTTIRGQRYNADGTTRSGEFTVASAATGFDVGEPDVIALGTGFLVTYSRQFSANDIDIYGRIYNANGIGASPIALIAPSADQTSSETAPLFGGGFAMVYDEDDGDVALTFWDAAGSQVGGIVQVNTAATVGIENFATVTQLNNGNVVVAWNGPSAINFRVFSGGGTPLTAELTAASGGVGELSLTAVGSDRFLVLWASTNGVAAHLYDATGASAASQYVVSPVGMIGDFPEAVTLTDGRVMSTWWVSNTLYGRIFDPLTGVGESAVVLADGVTASSNNNSNVSLSRMNDGRIAVSFNGGGGNADIFTQIFDPRDGQVNPLGTVSGALYGNDFFNDQVTGSTNDDQLYGLDGNDFLMGRAGIDTLYGGGGDDRLDGGADSDTLVGGTGNDIYFADSGDSIVELAGEGIDEVRTTANIFTLAANVDNLTLTNAASHAAAVGNAINNVIRGNIGADELYGQDGNDTLYDGGGSGIDSLLGGRGDDVYVVEQRSSSTIENSGEGTDEVRTAFSIYGLQANVENLTFTDGGTHGAGVGNALNNVLSGNTGGDDLFGREGDDTLYGGTGTPNTLLGQQGNDTYYVDAVGDSVIESAGEGADTVFTSISSYTLSANVEQLVYTGTGAFIGVGNGLANLVRGGALADSLNGLDGDDVIIGMSGADTLQGGTGNDQFRYLGGETGLDRILDFTSGSDKVVLLASGFSQTNQVNFVQGGAPAPTLAVSTFLYDVNTGIVSYDPDGSASDGIAPILLAQLNAGLTLAAGDFFFV